MKFKAMAATGPKIPDFGANKLTGRNEWQMEIDKMAGDTRTPREIATLVETAGVSKAQANAPQFLLLSILAGAFISMGAIFFAVLITGSSLGFGLTRLVGGIGFSMGLMLVVIAGAELFTGNNLIAMAWASRLVSTMSLLRSWALAYLGNVIGCLLTVWLVVWADIGRLADGAVGQTLVEIAEAKLRLSWDVAFARGILCNALVCLAVWVAMAGRGVADKILAILLPVSAFVVLGLEHSIANWFFLPMGLLLGVEGTDTTADVVKNLAAVTAGNIVGGTVLVAGIYWFAYLRKV